MNRNDGIPENDECLYPCNYGTCRFRNTQPCPEYVVTRSSMEGKIFYDSSDPMEGGYCDKCTPTRVEEAEPTQHTDDRCPITSATCSSGCQDSGTF